MAHEVENMAYFGSTPWHGLGTVLEENDCKNWETVSEKAGLSWEVEKVKLQTMEETPIEADGHYLVRRKSDGKQYGTVKKNWEPLQNSDAFKWFQPWIDSGLARFETAGSLKEGRVIFALAEIIGVEADVIDGDRIKEYVMLSNSHDGSLAVRGGFTRVRVVCNNTLTEAHHSESSKLLRIKHTKKLGENMLAVRDTMDLIRGEFIANVEQYRKLAVSTISWDDVVRLVKKHVLEVDPTDPEMSTRNKNILDEVLDSVKTSPGADSAPRSMWQAYNGVNWFLLNKAGTKGEKSNRLHSAWFGPNKTKDGNFLNSLLKMIGLGK